MSFQLVLSGDSGRESFRFSAGSLVVGRAPGNDIVLEDDRVSREHAKVEAQGDRCFVVDLESANGTFVNGRLVSRHELTAGDEIRCYYSGLPVTACWAGQPEADEHQIISTGLARWRRDRILSISLSRGFSEGCLMLDPLPVEGGRGVQAVLNADGDEAQGGVRLALLDPGSRAALPGFSFDDCEVRRIDASTVEGRWQGSAMPAGVASAVPCVQLRDASARLYSVEYSQTHGGKVPGAMRRVGSVIPGEPRATRETDRVARGAATKCQALSMAASG